MIGFYDVALSPYAQKVKIALLEKGIEFETRATELGAPNDEFEAASPKREVPALVDGDLQIFESSVILDYLEDKFPESPLLPADPAGRAKARMIEQVCDTQLEAITWGMTEVLAFKRAEGELAQSVLGTAANEIATVRGWLAAQLGDGPWFGGEAFGYADAAVFPFLQITVLYKQGPEEGTPLADWLGRMYERASVQRVLAEGKAAVAGFKELGAKIMSGERPRQYRDHRVEFLIRAGARRSSKRVLPPALSGSRHYRPDGIREGAMKANIQGIDIHYTLEGPAHAPVVTMSHSLMCDGSMWQVQLPVLEDYRVLRVDTRGHGGSDAPEGPYTLEQLADDFLHLLDQLEIERTHYIGISMGGMIGQVLGIKAGDRLHSLTLCNTMCEVPEAARAMFEDRVTLANAEGMEAHVEPTIERWFSPEFCAARPDQVDPIRELIRTTPIPGFAGCCLAIAQLNLTDQLGSISTPTLVITGKEDPGATPEVAETIQRNISGAELCVIDGALHLSNIEQPEIFNAAFSAHISKH